MELWKRVTVGPDVFEALSSEERISILKLLDQNKQMTGTDVANVLGISKSSAFKQLNRLARAGLVERMDEGRKWIYYRNTSKAERLLHPEDVTITLVLSAALAAVLAGMLILVAMGPSVGLFGPQRAAPTADDPNLLILSHPTATGADLVVQVYAGSAELSDIAIFVASQATGAVVATAPSQTSPMLLSHSSPAATTSGPSVFVKDANGDGALNTGDLITVAGLEDAPSYTLWVASTTGVAMATAPLGL